MIKEMFDGVLGGTILSERINQFHVEVIIQKNLEGVIRICRDERMEGRAMSEFVTKTKTEHRMRTHRLAVFSRSEIE
jgi:hypothetical protein